MRNNVNKVVKYKTFAVKEDILGMYLDCSMVRGRTWCHFLFRRKKKGDVSPEFFWKLCGLKMKDIFLLNHQIVTNFGYETLL